MRNLSFESKNLVVDWISFKFQHLDNFIKTELTNYLLKIGFNSYQKSDINILIKFQ